MDKHYGQIVELVIRKKGISISELARSSNINRKCVYNWFNQKYLKPEVIHRIGGIIKHDFSVEFPELFTPEDFMADQSEHEADMISDKDQAENKLWKDKYIVLLEHYNQLLLKHIKGGY
jgi:lambda repressor-like predicted transcriptional regulator